MAATKQIGDKIKITAGLHKDQIATLVGKEGRAWQVELENGEKVLVPFPQVAVIEAAAVTSATDVEPEHIAEKPTDDSIQDSADSQSDESDQPDADSDEGQADAIATAESDPPAEELEVGPDGTVTVSFQIQGTDIIGSNSQPQPPDDSGDVLDGESDSEPEGESDSGQTDEAGPVKEKAKRSGKRERSLEGIDDSDLNKLNVVQLQALAINRGIGIARTKTDFLNIIKELRPNEDLDRLRGKDLFDRVSQLHISRLRNKADLITLLQG